MTDFNMPPGVSARDIPGQDEAPDLVDQLQAAASRASWPEDADLMTEAGAEIDRLRLMEKNSNERWQHENKLVERMALAAFSVLNHPESPECHFELKQAVMAMGFCPRCEWRPCECGERYDD